MSVLLLAAGGALIAVASSTAANAADSTSEAQAYYAAESGLQEVLAVLRGNVAPSPLFNSTLSDPANKITFRKAVSLSTSNLSSDTYAKPRLSRWMSYSGTSVDGTANVVPVSDNFAPLSGIAYGVEEIRDPDNSDVVVFSTSGTFDNTSPPGTFGTCCNGNSNGFILSYTPAATTTVSTLTSGASNLGSISITDAKGTFSVTNAPFTLNINQTAPWASSDRISCTITGSVTKSGGTITSTLVLTIPKLTYNVNGVKYTLPSLAVPISGSSATTLSVTLTAPEPQRLVIKVIGYGPRGAQKKMKMMVGRSLFTYNPKGAITLRSADDNTTAMSFNVGSSSQFGYSGYDNSGGAPLPAFTVTSDPDYNLINNLPANQVVGSPFGATEVPVSSLDAFLQTTGGVNGARALVNELRTAAQNQGRYFAAGQTPSDFGATAPNGLLTFVDGDADLPPAGGAGLLVVTGTLTTRGSASFNGLVLVLGTGDLDRSGGGNGGSLGAVVVARFDSTSNFLAPTFNTSGGGTSAIQYDSDWVRRALSDTGPGVLGISEY
jgi:phage baseplate assembly protein gpV